MTKTFIQIKTRFEGVHYYPGAPDEVSFLKLKHRHEFHVRVRLEVGHDDREIEFFMLKREVNEIISHWGKDLGSTSCERMCLSIYTVLRNRYGFRSGEIEISEDGENSAVLEFDS